MELLKFLGILEAERGLQPRSLAILHPVMAGAGSIGPAQASLIVDGTLAEITEKKVVCIDPSDLRRLAAKAAQGDHLRHRALGGRARSR